jgi:ATP-dependent Clp protease ATP-binding subunit ClpA
MTAALDAADEFSHGYVGDEHILLALLDQPGPARRFLERHGLTLAAARTDLLHLTAAGGIPQPSRDDAADLRAVGIDLDQVSRQLTAAFGSAAVARAVRRASRRPWWRGGGRRRTPLCGKPLAAKRALAFAVDDADRQGRRDVGPEHLLSGVLRDAADPLGTGLSRRGRKRLRQMGWDLRTGNPAAAILAARGLDPTQLRSVFGGWIERNG